MTIEDWEYLEIAGKLMTASAEMAGDAILLLIVAGRVDDANKAEAGMLQFLEIARRIGYILDDLVMQGVKKS